MARAIVTDNPAYRLLSALRCSHRFASGTRGKACEAKATDSVRLTRITLAIRGGALVPIVQKGARHGNVQTTMRYAHDMDSLDDAAGDYVKL